MEGREEPRSTAPSPIRATRFTFLQHLKLFLASEGFVYDDRPLLLSFFYFRYFIRACFEIVICLGGYLIFAYATTAKIRLTLLLLFPIFIFGQICFVALRHRFAKERYNFPLNDFIVAEPANTFTEAVGNDSVSEQVEGARDKVGMNLIVSLIRVGAILQAIHGIGELTDFGVSDCEFDFVQ
jgi:hypothetical protein